MRGVAWLPVTLVLANLCGLAVSLIVPLLLDPQQYTVFALCWGAGQLCASIAYEGLRFGVLRYSVGADAGLMATRRGLLWGGYGGVTAALLAIAGVALLALAWQPLAGLAAAVAFYAACQGTFEGRQAVARAGFDNQTYSVSWLVRSGLSLVLAAGGAVLTGSGAIALVGLALSYPLTMLVMGGLRRLPAKMAGWDGRQAAFLVRFGVMAALASNLSVALPMVMRLIATAHLGLEQAAGVMLAMDLSQKALAMVGLAVNIVMMQRTITAVEFETAEALARQARLQILATGGLVIAAALGFWLVQGPVVALLIAAPYRQSYGEVIGLCCVASAMLSLRLFAMDSLLVALGRAGGAVAGPVVAVGVVSVLATMSLSAPKDVAAVFVASTGAGCIVAAGVLWRGWGRVRA